MGHHLQHLEALAVLLFRVMMVAEVMTRKIMFKMRHLLILTVMV